MFGRNSPKKTGIQKSIFLIGFIGAIGLAIFPIIIQPMINSEKYRKIQEVTRKDIDQKSIQPGNMNIWRDPFDRKK